MSEPVLKNAKSGWEQRPKENCFDYAKRLNAKFKMAAARSVAEESGKQPTSSTSTKAKSASLVFDSFNEAEVFLAGFAEVDPTDPFYGVEIFAQQRKIKSRLQAAISAAGTPPSAAIDWLAVVNGLKYNADQATEKQFVLLSMAAGVDDGRESAIILR